MEFISGTALHGASRFCFGCEQLGGVDWGDVDIDELQAAIEFAVAQGVNFFDTAAVYGLGQSERRLSDILGEKRLDVIVATKGGLAIEKKSRTERATVTRDTSPDAIKASVSTSLERLRVDRLQVFFVHWPDPDTPIEATMNTLMSFKQAGKIKSIGLSNFNCQQIRAAQRFGDVDIVQVAFSLLSRENCTVIKMCRDQGIPVCAYGVLAQGLLTGKYYSNKDFSVEDRRHRLQQFSPDNIDENLLVVKKVRELAMRLGRIPAQIAIRYALQYPGISSVVVGIKSRHQLSQCTDVFDWELSAQDVAFLEN